MAGFSSIANGLLSRDPALLGNVRIQDNSGFINSTSPYRIYRVAKGPFKNEVEITCEVTGRKYMWLTAYIDLDFEILRIRRTVTNGLILEAGIRECWKTMICGTSIIYAL